MLVEKRLLAALVNVFEKRCSSLMSTSSSTSKEMMRFPLSCFSLPTYLIFKPPVWNSFIHSPAMYTGTPVNSWISFLKRFASAFELDKCNSQISCS